MPANNQSIQKEIESLKYEIQDLKLSQEKVYQPALKSIQIDVKTLLQMDYLTKNEAKSTYVSREQFSFLEDKYKSLQKVGFVILSAVVTGMVTLLFAYLQVRLAK